MARKKAGRGRAVAFENGLLIVSGRYPHKKISAWPDLRAWIQAEPGSPWFEETSLDCVPVPETVWEACAELNGCHYQYAIEDCLAEGSHGNARSHRACLEFADRIPGEVRRWCMAFKCGRLRMLKAFGVLGPVARDLARGQSQALLYALAHLDYFLPVAADAMWEAAARIAQERQRGIWQRLLGRGEEGFARLMRKFTSRVVNLRLLWRMGELYQRPMLRKALAHVRTIDLPLAWVLEDDRRLTQCTSSLMRQLAGPSDPIMESVVHDLFSKCTSGGSGPFCSLESMEAELIRAGKITLGCSAREFSVSPGEPPLDGLRGLVEPLATLHEIQAEGEQMQNCLAQGANQFLNGFVYRILPLPYMNIERATMQINCGLFDDEWHLVQVAGRGNGPVNAETQALARRFVKYAQLPRLSREQLRERCLFPRQVLLPFAELATASIAA